MYTHLCVLTSDVNKGICNVMLCYVMRRFVASLWNFACVVARKDITKLKVS